MFQIFHKHKKSYLKFTSAFNKETLYTSMSWIFTAMFKIWVSISIKQKTYIIPNIKT